MPEWNKITDKDSFPEQKRVLVLIKYGSPNKRYWITVAEYIPAMTEEDSEEAYGTSNYDENTDIYYVPEGWYEYPFDVESNLKINGEVIYWMPLPEKPPIE
jgi:hypothetical protein